MNVRSSFVTSSVCVQKHALMEQAAHQAIVMKFILDLAQTLKVDPRGCFRPFFSKIKVGNSALLPLFLNTGGKIKTSCGFRCPPQTADEPYRDAFHQELESLKERVRACAQARMESAVKELEEEDRQQRLGPGGLDPVEVYQSLPKVGAPVLRFWRGLAGLQATLHPRDGALIFCRAFLSG